MLNYFLYFISLFALSQSPNIVKLAEAPVDIFGFWRMFISGLLILPIALTRGRLIQTLKVHKRDFHFAIVSGLFFYTHLWTFFFAAKNTTIANGMIIYATNPLFTALGAYIFFNEKFTLRISLAYILAVSGIYYLFSQSMHLSFQSWLGDTSALISAILFAGYILSGKRARTNFSNFSFSAIIYLVACICFGLSGLIQGNSFSDYQTNTWLAIAASIALPTLLGHFLFTYLMKFMNINIMTLGKVAEPIISTFFAYFLFKEELTTHSAIAFVFVAASVITLLYNPSRPRRADEVPKTAPEDI